MRWRETAETQDGDALSHQNAKREHEEVEEKLNKRRGVNKSPLLSAGPHRHAASVRRIQRKSSVLVNSLIYLDL